jgi:hypothetical protein
LTGVIVDLFLRDDAEWMRMQDGREILLREITRMSP